VDLEHQFKISIEIEGFLWFVCRRWNAC